MALEQTEEKKTGGEIESETWDEGNGGNEIRTGTRLKKSEFWQWVDTQGNHSSNILLWGTMVHRLWFIDYWFIVSP